MIVYKKQFLKNGRNNNGIPLKSFSSWGQKFSKYLVKVEVTLKVKKYRGIFIANYNQ